MIKNLADIIGDSFVLINCEGSAEKAIIDILIENNKLIFDEKNILEGCPTCIRDSKKIEERFLNLDYAKEVKIIRTLDSRRENFILGKLYRKKFKVVNVYTHPEIEILIIIAEDKYEKYTNMKNRTNYKPSRYCIDKLGYKNVKQYLFVKRYFADVDMLIQTLATYHSYCCDNNEYSLYNLVLKYGGT
ncbi:MAG: hypothetical protein ACYCYI_03265 [Saccharofermentanales bacterium]